jgi:hypothetical protein
MLEQKEPGVRLVMDKTEVESNTRLIGIRLSIMTLRCMTNWRELVDDCDKLLILMAVAAITGERFTRGDALEEPYRDLRTTIPKDRNQYGNVTSIAAATGLNRETTRRKINELIEARILMRTAGTRVRFNPASRQVDRVLDLVRRQLDVVIRHTNELIRDGAVVPA